jgi:hypothetical protein
MAFHRLHVWCLLLAIGASCERADVDLDDLPVPAPAPAPQPEPAPGTTSPTYPTLTFSGNTTFFGSGSIIIPTGASFQDQCGAVSAYGLVYDVLRAEDWLAKNGYQRITVHYVYRGEKASPNRCMPTSASVPPSPSGSAAWNDGCDFNVSGAEPVKLVNNTEASTPADDTTLTSTSSTSRSDVYPTYAAVAVTNSVTEVGYLGGPFVIQSGSDATTFGKLLQGAITALDDNNNAIDFTPFRTTGTCSALGAEFHVNLHRAQYGFWAEDNEDFTAAPPRLALLDQNQAGYTNTVYSGIMQSYLSNAGLGFSTAIGCPIGGYNVANKTLCPNGTTPGQIFDLFDFADLSNNLVNAVGSNGKPLYGALWTPHWDTSATSTKAPNAHETAAATNVRTFLGSAQTGLFAECASIEGFEGDYDNGPINEQATSQFLTCVNNGSGGCSATPAKEGIDKDTTGTVFNQLKNCSDPSEAAGNSCAYYGYPGDSYSQTGDYIWNAATGSVQSFEPAPETDSIYRPLVRPVISSVKSLVIADLASPAAARAMITNDLAAYGYMNSNVNIGQIHYMSGHNLSGDVGGNLLILQTLLQLGNGAANNPPTTTEVARAAPILTTVGTGPAILQGTLDLVSPTPPTPTIGSDADISVFSFPFVVGHMYAIPVGSAGGNVTTTGEAFSRATRLFDAANEIPPAVYGGCGAPFGSSCRTVFTTTGTGRFPTGGGGSGSTASYTFVSSSNRAALTTALIGSGATLANSTLDTLLTDVIKAPLGGVDRSAVAVATPSGNTTSADGVSGANRPTMIYFGAADGMLHAVCAAAQAGTGCDVEGRELWAFLPRVQLPMLRFNKQWIEGSPHLVDAFGDFYGTGVPSFKTILTFHTGTGAFLNNNAATVADQLPAVYALDITDPTQPRVLWEYTVPNPSQPREFELGQGLTIAMGNITTQNGEPEAVTFVETNNGNVCTSGCGSSTAGGAGAVVIALNTATGAELWTQPFGYLYTSAGKIDSPPVPTSAVPGGAVGVDLQLTGSVSALVFGDIVGDLWKLNPANGSSFYGSGVPLYEAPATEEPVGVTPSIYAVAGTQFAAFATGGYVDFTDNGSASNLWSGSNQYMVSVDLSSSIGDLTETSTSTTNGIANVPIHQTLGAGEKGFAALAVVGNELVLVTSSSDVNNSSYGVSSTGTAQAFQVGTGGVIVQTNAATAINGGAAPIASDGTNLYASSGTAIAQVPSPTGEGTGTAVNGQTGPKGERLLFLRTQ